MSLIDAEVQIAVVTIHKYNGMKRHKEYIKSILKDGSLIFL